MIKASAVAFAASLLLGGAGRAAAIALPGDRAFPESITSTADGTLFVSSPGAGGVLRIRPGQKPESFVAPAAFGTRSTFGVLADDKAKMLWVCSNDVSALGAPGPSDVKGAWVKGFDLATGDGKVSARLPGPREFCNDMAVMPDGGLLVTDSFAPHILRLAAGSTTLAIWSESPLFKPPAQGAGLDGIVLGGDGKLYVDLFNDAKLLRVDLGDGGQPGKVTQLEASRGLQLTDALRAPRGASFLMIEGSGKLDRVTVDGDRATIATLVDGLNAPTGVAKVGDTAFVTEGQLPKLFGRAAGGPSLPFKVIEAPLR